MTFSDPIFFVPQCFERVWGGRKLADVFNKPVADPEIPTGESWEVVDRPEAVSAVDGGKYAGLTLHQLWAEQRDAVFGAGLPQSEHFPLLIKILDAADKLSIQVHPPAAIAAGMGGEPKTESWILAGVDPDAALYVGFSRQTTREQFAAAIENGSVTEVVHELRPQAGDFIHLPSGRLHAIGAGCLIFEIQQNSDTTYRVYDWDRKGLDGKPRELHVEESLQCIDFDDVAPSLGQADGERLVSCEYYTIDRWELAAGAERDLGTGERFAIVAVVTGNVKCGGRSAGAGTFFIAPVGCAPLVAAGNGASVLVTRIP